MPDKSFQPQIRMILQDLESLKVVADPLRNQIMEVLTQTPLTVNQVAQRLGIDSSNIYYHISLLEKHGFVRVVDTTLHGNLIEKHYWVTAYKYELDENMLCFTVETAEGTQNLITMLLTNIDAAKADLVRSMNARHSQIASGAEPNPRHIIDYRHVVRIPDQRAAEFAEKLNILLAEFKAQPDSSGEKDISWALTVLMHPSFYFEEDRTSPD